MDTDPGRYPTHRVEVAPGLPLAFAHEGAGGYPLLLIHGWPETRRIWWRNIGYLADAGFEVIAPDLRGFGDSGLAADGFYDTAAFAHDLYRLVHDHLGHEHCTAVGGDLGGVVAEDMALRFPGFVERLCLFNTIPPYITDQYEAAGIAPDSSRSLRATADYFLRQGREADQLAAELDTTEKRRRYIAEFYGHRLWGSPGSFDQAGVDFMTEPFADGDHLRASFGCYEAALGKAQSAPPQLFSVIDVPTLVLYGPDDHVIPASFPERCRVAFSECIGPFWVPGAGHFLQWEAAETLNLSLKWFLADRRRAS